MDRISELTDTITNKDDTINKFQKMLLASKSEKHMGKDNPFQLTLFNYEQVILSIMVYTFNSYKEDSYAAIGRAA